MEIGIQTFFTGQEPQALSEYLPGVGRAIEELGFSSVWVAEHVVTFPKYDMRYPYPYTEGGVPPEFLATIGVIDPMSSLMALAVCTSKIKLGTSIAILPQRNPVYFAKEATSIDHVSGGRFIAGVGIGWSAQEYEVLGVPWEGRGARMDEHIKIVKSMWEGNSPKFDGKFYQIAECVQLPRPIQRPHPPIYIGGESDPALRRIAALGQGWLAFCLTPDQLSKRIARLEVFLAEQGRTLDDIDIVVCPGVGVCDPESLPRYAELGVSQVIVTCMGENIASFRANAEALAESLILPAGRL